MTFRRPLAVLLAAGLALTAAACSDDGPEEGSGSSTSTTSAPEQTTTTLDDEEFGKRMDEVQAIVDAAGSDLCAVVAAPQALPSPSSPAQLERVLQLYKEAIEVAAAALETDDPQSAEVLRTGAADLLEEAAAVDYDIRFLTGDSAPESVSSPEYMKASEALNAKYAAECGPPGAGGGSGAPDTTVPEAAPEG